MSVVEDGLIYAAARDVTAHKESEAALRQMSDELEVRVQKRTAELARANEELKLRETMLQAQGEASIDGILIVNPEGKILSFNRRFVEMWNIPPDVIAQESDSAALQAVLSQLHDPASFLAIVASLYKNEDELSQEELVLADGRTFYRYSAPIKGAEGLNYGRIWFFRDITERKQFEFSIHQAREEAERARENAESANLAKSEFLSRMSHELRTPLNAILGFSQILDLQDLNPLQQESIDYIRKGGQHLLSLINEILDIARIEAGHMDLSIEPVELVDIIEECCALVRPLADQRRVQVQGNLQILDACEVMADRQRLKQVLINLLSNGIKYNRDEGQVTVSVVQMPDQRVRIQVRDTGVGLSPKELEKLFTPFERLHASNSQIEGSGLGLVLSRQLMAVQSGTLEVESQSGQGSTFWIELPAAEASARAQEEVPANQQSQAVPEGEPQYTVLSIEDNLSNIRLLETILANRPDINLLAAMQGTIGLDLARQHKPDVILLDLHLPGLSGYEVLQLLMQSAETQSIPVIIISADATSTQIEKLIGSGARAFLTKPINVKEFLHIFDEVLGEIRDV